MRSIPTVLTALGLLLLAGCSAGSAIERSRNFARLGDYKHAFEVLDDEHMRQLEAGNVDDRLAHAHQVMHCEYLRDRAQSLIFQEREDEALLSLDRLAAADPDHPALAELREAAMLKKATRIVARGNKLLAKREFASAMEAFIESQRLVPSFALADDGMEAVRKEMARLSKRARQQFLQAVRKVPEFRHIEVAWHADTVIHLSPEAGSEQREDAVLLRENARKNSAKETFAHGRECERANQFGAALVLFKAAQLLDPEIEGAVEAIAKMERELKAMGLLEEAQVDMRSGRFAAANELLSEAFEISTLLRGSISELMIESRQLEGKQEHREALDLEVMGKKVEALAAFEALAKKWPDGLDDEAARIVGLRIDVESALAAWEDAEKAEAKGDLAQALVHYQTAESFYAEWRDGEAQIARLRKLIAEQAIEAGEAVEAGGGGGS